MYVHLDAKGHLFLSDWNLTYIFWRDVSKTSPLCNFKKACQVGARLNYVDSQTHKKANTFCNFANVPKFVDNGMLNKEA